MSRSALEGLGVVGSRRLGCPGSQVRLSDPFPITSSSLQCSDSTSQLQPQFHQGAGFVRCGVRASGKGGHRDRASFAGVLQSPICYSQSHRGWRPVIDISLLNGWVALSSFHMETAQSVLQSLRPGDWMVSLDLQDAYLQVPVHPASRRYLRFCVGDAVFQFTTLCFGLSSASQVFTRVMAPISSIMHRHGFRLLRYLGDWLVLGSTFQDLGRARDFLLWLCLRLGVIVNLSKSSLDPTQTLDYLGMTLETSPLRVSLTLKRVQKLSLLLHQFFSDRLQPVSGWRSLLGMMSSMSSIVPGSRLRMRSLQLRLNAAGRLLLDHQLVSWDDTCLRDLRWWSDDSCLLVGFYLGEYLPDLCLFSDASDQGWGAALGDLHLSGLWSLLCSSFSINQRELLAILFAIRGFLPHLRGQTVAVYSDNSTALAYLRKQGGTHSSSLNEVAQVLLRLCEDQSVRLPAIHSRSSQCPGGFSQPSVPGPRFGMDLMSSSLRRIASPLAYHDRPVRDSYDPSPPGVLFSNVRSDVCRHRCDVTILGRSPGVCLSPVQPHSSGPGEGSGVPKPGAHVSGSVLASTPVVPGPSGASVGNSSSFPNGKIFSDSPISIASTSSCPCYG